MIKLSEVLQKLLSDKKMTVTELARVINIPQPTIHRITSGKHHRPHEKTVQAIACYFGITEAQLFGYEEIAGFNQQNEDVAKQMLTIPIIPLDKIKDNDFRPENYLTMVGESCKNVYATIMPDGSMEPVIPENAILLINPDKRPNYKSFVVIKMRSTDTIVIRQYISDGKNIYIRPLSQDFGNINITPLEDGDQLLGVVIEVRFQV